MDLGRRSSRTARTSAPVQTTSQHSSTSSNSSSRAERATRSNPKHDSSRKPHRSTSSSSDPTEPPSTEDLTTTRGKRGRAADREKSSRTAVTQIEAAKATEDTGDDDEAVRCICGYEEYPGPPQLDEDNKNGIKEGIEAAGADISEDLAGFYLQCDVCKVWQHGGCVGIMSEDSSPDEYFCEECRKDLHQRFTAPNGQTYSHYLPLYQSLSATTSRAASFSKDGTKSPRGTKASRQASLQSAKRRSTMNSRDAAYDEEQIRLAIVASREENGSDAIAASVTDTRRGKRGRSGSDEPEEDAKRQKTTSRSPSLQPQLTRLASQAESDDGAANRLIGAKKIRGAAARNHREKEMREEKERQRFEARQKRIGRAERRRVDESDAAEESPVPMKATIAKITESIPKVPEPPAVVEIPTPDTPPAILPPSSQKKGGRPPNTQKKKLGKNQYTKDRDAPEKNSPHRSQSREVQKDDTSGSTTKSSHDGRHAKNKSLSTKYTMFDMKRRVNAILEFITRTQLEMAGDAMSVETQQATMLLIGDLAGNLPMIKVNGQGSNGGSTATTSEATSPTKEFKDLSLMEQMDNLTRQLVKWQKEFL